jgi:hypothetical protein
MKTFESSEKSGDAINGKTCKCILF